VETVPFYLDPDSPYRLPLASHNAMTSNVLLKVTVPRRTGRKRRRGTEGPWEAEMEMTDESDPSRPLDKVCSISRLDDPRIMRRKLQDNVSKYRVEAVGLINHTHRFRGE
jgi:general transcription factor 3C polypeptide 5 (transcription factor C subunit 1)